VSAGPVGPERPRIGLVLGGGGAKGAAHVGVLQVLDEMRIPIDCIAGTSMGALVGGIFASGTAPEEIERAIQGIDWRKVVGGQGFRDKVPIDDKIADLGNANAIEFGLRQGRLETPKGLIRTQEIDDVIRSLVSTARYTADFDDLPIPFRAMATDMVSETSVTLDRGDLATAMRASMAIPGAFSPVEWDDKLLSDGGLLKNLPVDVARDLCADNVIAVWLNSAPPGDDELTTAVSLIYRSLDVVINANEQASVDSLQPDDIGIAVNTGDIRTNDFLRMSEAIDIGRAAAESQRSSLAKFSVSDDDYNAWKASLRSHDTNRPVLAGVDIIGLDRVSENYVTSLVRHSTADAPFDEDLVIADVERIYASGDFERVDYRFVGTGSRPTLEIRPVEKSWGPDFVSFDYGLATDFESELLASLRADHTRTWINRYGGQWQNTIQLGQKSLLSTSFYQPIDIRQRYFIDATARFDNSLEDIYLDGDRAARYFFREAYGQVDVGMNIGTRAQLRAGLRSGVFSADVDTGIPGLPEVINEKDTSIMASAIYDTRDNTGLPTSGMYLSARYRWGEDWFGSRQRYQIAEAVMTKAFNFRGNSLSLILAGAENVNGDLPPNFSIRLGGIRTFPGLRKDELRGPKYWLAGATYLWRLAETRPLFGQSVYAGVRLTAGEMRDRFDDVDDGTLMGIAASLQGRMALGSFLLSLGYVNNSTLRLQFSIGRPLDEGSLLDAIY
jgi:NTE family protein